MDVQLSARAGQACTVVWVTGELDMDTGPQVQEFVQHAVDAGARQVVLDFTGVPFMDSGGLGALVDLLKLLRDKGGRLSVAGVQAPVRNVLALSAVDQVVDLYDTVAAAEDDMPPPAG